MRRVGLSLVASLALAGCQTAGSPSPLAYTVAGSHEALASCFARAEPEASFVVSDVSADRTVSVDVNAARPDGYRVAFAPLSPQRTQVSAAQRGGTAPAPVWRDEVLPTLARCIRQAQG